MMSALTVTGTGHAPGHSRWALAALCTLVWVGASSNLQASSDDADYLKPEAVARHALVIGIETYDHADPAIHALNDAQAVGASLKTLGFDVTTIVEDGKPENAKSTTRPKLLDEIDAYFKALKPDDITVVFYAGHGVEVDGVDYLVPADAHNDDVARVVLDNVPVPYLMSKAETARAGVSLLVLDACRTNPFVIRDPGGRALPYRGGLGEITPPVSTMIAFAAAPGQIASGGDATMADSYYTTMLLRYVHKPGMMVEGLFKSVRRDVLAATANAQQPWESSALLGDFFFQSDQQEEERQRTDWEALFRNTPTVDLISQYIDLNPGSAYVRSARRWLETHPSSDSGLGPVAGWAPPSLVHAGPVSGAVTTPDVTFAQTSGPEAGRLAVATRLLDVYEGSTTNSKLLGTLHAGDAIYYRGSPDRDGWLTVEGRSFGKGFVKGVKTDWTRGHEKVANIDKEILREAVHYKSDGDLVGNLKKSTASSLAAQLTALANTYVMLGVAPSGSDTPARARQLAFSRFVRTRAALVAAGVESNAIFGSVSSAAAEPGASAKPTMTIEARVRPTVAWMPPSSDWN